jgi:lipopolysaccharide export system permease protein
MAALVALVCYAVNLYFMPLAYREFKDLQFSIRNDYSSVLLQEGTFNNVVDGVTVYVRERKSDGELLGILVHDERVPDNPVTMMAERGALVQTANGPRVVMVNGNRQAIEKGRERQLSILYFDQYSLDFDTTTQSGGPRWREARERYLDELFWPGNSADDIRQAASLRAEGHQRLSSPLLTVAFAMIALAALLAGEFNRRGQVRRVLWATAAVAVIQLAYLGAFNLAARIPAALLLLYLIPLAAIVGGLYVLLRNPSRRAGADVMARV